MDEQKSRFLFEEFNKVPEKQRDNRILHCLQSVLLSEEQKFYFLVESDLSFDVEVVEFSGGIVLKPWPQPHYRLDGRNITDPETQQIFEQLREGRYSIIGEYPSFHDLTNIGPQVLEATHQIDHCLAVLGFVTGAKIHWYPTVSGYRPNSKTKPTPAMSMSTVLAQGQANQAKLVWETLNSLPEDDRETIIAAIDWHWQGHNSPSVLNSFESFWKAIEGLSTTWRDKLGTKKDDAPINLILSEIEKTEWKRYLTGDKSEINLPTSKIPRFVRFVSGFVNPTARSNITTVFNHCFNQKEATSLVRSLFDGKPSMKDLRDEIAHGLVTEADHEKKSLIERKIPELEKISRKFIIASLNRGLS